MSKVKHTVNGDQQNGWYCYECDFFTRDVTEAAAHDGQTLAEDMLLPEGKTCGDCIHIKFCVGLFGCEKTNTLCDWAPSRFCEPVADPAPPEKEKQEK